MEIWEGEIRGGIRGKEREEGKRDEGEEEREEKGGRED